MSLSFKVDRVTSTDEIRALEELGVEYIGLDVDEDAFYGIDLEPFWKDERYLTLAHLPELLPELKRAQAFVDVPQGQLSPEVIDGIAEQSVGLAQIMSRFPPDQATIKACSEKNVRLIYGHEYVVPEDKPLFKRSGSERPCLAFVDVQLLPSERDAWWSLTEFAPRHPGDVITLDDVAALAAEVPLFVSLNASPMNIAAIVETLSRLGVQGLSFTLSATKYGSFHTFVMEDVLTTLKALRQN